MFFARKVTLTTVIALSLAVGLFGRGVFADRIFAKADAEATLEGRLALHLEDAIERMRSAVDALSDLTAEQKTRLKADLESGLRAEVSSRPGVRGRIPVNAMIRAIRTAAEIKSQAEARFSAQALASVGLHVARLGISGVSESNLNAVIESGIRHRWSAAEMRGFLSAFVQASSSAELTADQIDEAAFRVGEALRSRIHVSAKTASDVAVQAVTSVRSGRHGLLLVADLQNVLEGGASAGADRRGADVAVGGDARSRAEVSGDGPNASHGEGKDASESDASAGVKIGVEIGVKAKL